MALAPTAGQGARWTEEMADIAPRSYLGEVRVRFLRNPTGVAALVVILLLGGASLLAPWVAPSDPLVGQATERLRGIGSSGHILGTDELGRDMLTRLLHGGRVSLLTGIVPVAIATVLGTAVGAIAGYLKGAWAALIMRSLDMFYALPATMLAIAIAASLGAGTRSTIIAITVVFVPPIARVAESATRQVVVHEYIEAARLSGANLYQVLVHQVLANIFNPVFVYASSLVGISIVIASGLSFLGLGSAPPTPEWGYMLNSLRGSIYVAPWVAVLPGVCIFVTSMAFNVLSDALRDALDLKAE